MSSAASSSRSAAARMRPIALVGDGADLVEHRWILAVQLGLLRIGSAGGQLEARRAPATADVERLDRPSMGMPTQGSTSAATSGASRGPRCRAPAPTPGSSATVAVGLGVPGTGPDDGAALGEQDEVRDGLAAGHDRDPQHRAGRGPHPLGENGSTEPSGNTTPAQPAASATRTRVPALPGSATPDEQEHRAVGDEVGHGRRTGCRAVARTPWEVTVSPICVERRRPGPSSGTATAASIGGACRSSTNTSDHEAGREGVGDQRWALDDEEALGTRGCGGSRPAAAPAGAAGSWPPRGSATPGTFGGARLSPPRRWPA